MKKTERELVTATWGSGRRNGPEGRDRVLDVATVLFRDFGFTGVSMSQISDRAGMTKAALYYHFRDKEDLFASVFEREIERAREHIDEQIAKGGSLRDILERIARYTLEEGSGEIVRMFGDIQEYVSEERRRRIP